MKQTKKYSGAIAILTYPHQHQDELYQELNRIGFFWDSKSSQWVRDDSIPSPASDLVRVRVWAASDKVEQAAQLFIEAASQSGLIFVEASKPYVCRPPQQNDSRVYLTFRNHE